MFKKLKERKEWEDKFGPNQGHNDNDSDDNLCSNDTHINSDHKFDTTVDSNDYSSEDIVSTDMAKVDNNWVNNNELSPIVDTSSDNDCLAVDVLNKQIQRLKNELVLLKTRNTSLETQVRQQSDERQSMSRQYIDKSEECIQLKSKLIEWESIGAEKDELLLRNAELSSRCQQLAQDLQSERQDRQELAVKWTTIEKQSESQTNNEKLLNRLNETIVRLEQSLNDKNKTIKLQQQRLHDMKKTFLQNQTTRSGLACLADDDRNASSGDERSPKHTIEANGDKSVRNDKTFANCVDINIRDELTKNELNFEYLRNVVFKYMISADYEVALHLIRAISVLLNFTKDEEQLIKETIAWKMSWIAPLVVRKPSLSANKK